MSRAGTPAEGTVRVPEVDHAEGLQVLPRPDAARVRPRRERDRRAERLGQVERHRRRAVGARRAVAAGGARSVDAGRDLRRRARAARPAAAPRWSWCSTTATGALGLGAPEISIVRRLDRDGRGRVPARRRPLPARRRDRAAVGHRPRQGDALGHLAGPRRVDRHLQAPRSAAADRGGGRARQAPQAPAARAAEARRARRTTSIARSTSSARRARGCARSSARRRRPSSTPGSSARRSRRAGSWPATSCAPGGRRSPQAQAARGPARSPREQVERRAGGRRQAPRGGRGGAGRAQRAARGALAPLLRRAVGGRARVLPQRQACRPRCADGRARLARGEQALERAAQAQARTTRRTPRRTAGSLRWRSSSPRSTATARPSSPAQLAELEEQLAAAGRPSRSSAPRSVEEHRVRTRERAEEPRRAGSRRRVRERRARRSRRRAARRRASAASWRRSTSSCAARPPPPAAPRALADELEVDPGYELALAAALDGRLGAASWPIAKRAARAARPRRRRRWPGAGRPAAPAPDGAARASARRRSAGSGAAARPRPRPRRRAARSRGRCSGRHLGGRDLGRSVPDRRSRAWP